MIPFQTTISIPLFSKSKTKVNELLTHLGSQKIVNGNHIYNLYYQEEYFLSEDKLFQIASIFKHAIIILDDLDLSRPQNEISLNEKSNEISNYKLLKTLQYFGYEQILILSSEKSELFKLIEQQTLQVFKDQNDSSLTQEELQNPLQLSIPTFQVASTIIKPCEIQFQMKNCQQQLYEQDLWLSILDPLNNNEQANLGYVMSGFMLTNQTILFQQQGILQKTIIIQMKDYFTKQSINYARQGDLIEIEFQHKKITGLALGLQTQKYKFQKIIHANIVFNRQDECGYEVRFKLAPIKFYFYGQQLHTFERTILGILQKNGEIKKNKQNKMDQRPYNIRFLIRPQYFPMQFLQFQFVCSNGKNKVANERQISFYGRIECQNPNNIMNRQNDIFNVYYLTVIENPSTAPKAQMIKNGVDIRNKCRICLQDSPQYAPRECGHLRYCVNCKESVLEAKQCLYCNIEITEMIYLNPIRLDLNLKQLQYLTKQQIVEYFSQNPSQDLTDFLKFDININVNIEQIKILFCRFCTKQFSQYFQICENKHCEKSCKHCNPIICLECYKPLSNKVKIITEFPDDNL